MTVKTQIITPDKLRSARGEQKEIERFLDTKRPKLRTSFPCPYCKKCCKNVDSFKLERYQKDGIDMMALIVTCHGTTHEKVLPEYGLNMISTDFFFDDPKMYSNNRLSPGVQINKEYKP